MTIPNFRAWHKGNNEMIEVKEINYHYESIYYNMGEISFDEFEIMQSTGIKDANETEVYEGDILSYSVHTYAMGSYGQVDLIEEVIYLDGAFMAGDYLLMDAMDDDEVEIIGNVYENPYLLQGETQ